jgi:hypothetical protein
VNSPAFGDVINVLHDESQGIVDIAVKLFMLTQMRAIRMAELLKRVATSDEERVSARRAERLTPELIRSVAVDCLAALRPLLQDLKSGRFNPALDDVVSRLKFDELRALAVENVPMPVLTPPRPIDPSAFPPASSGDEARAESEVSSTVAKKTTRRRSVGEPKNRPVGKLSGVTAMPPLISMSAIAREGKEAVYERFKQEGVIRSIANYALI